MDNKGLNLSARVYLFAQELEKNFRNFPFLRFSEVVEMTLKERYPGER